MTEDIRPVLSLWLTREEFLACYAFQWVALMTGAWGVEAMSSDEKDACFSSVGRGLLWAVRELSERHLRFKAIQMDERTGMVKFLSRDPIEPANELFLLKLRRGGMPSPIISCSVLLHLLEKNGIEQDTLDREPILHVLNAATKDREDFLAEVDADPELVAARESGLANFKQTLKEALTYAAYVRSKSN